LAGWESQAPPIKHDSRYRPAVQRFGRMRFLFATLQKVESDFYGRVGAYLAERGHEVVHLTFSRRAAALLCRKGLRRT
jgi:hypothetical protein